MEQGLRSMGLQREPVLCPSPGRGSWGGRAALEMGREAAKRGQGRLLLLQHLRNFKTVIQ